MAATWRNAIMRAIAAPNTDGAIWKRLLRHAGHALSPSTAQTLLSLDFTPEDKTRMRVLAAKAREGSLSDAEREEIDSYERVGNLLALMKSKARQRLNRSSGTKMRARARRGDKQSCRVNGRTR
jgi:hypothetical protein